MAAVCVLWFGASTALLAQSGRGDTSSDTLGTAIISVYKPSPSLTTATPVQRLDTLSLLRRGVTDIGAALRRMAGINLRDYGGAGGLKTVSVRGLGAAHTAVSYDGMPVSDARSGQIDLSRFSTDRLNSVSLEVADGKELLCPVRTLAAAHIGFHTAMPDTAALSMAAALRQGSFGMISPALSLSAPLSRRTAIGVSGDFFYATNDYPFTLRNGVATTRERRLNSRMQAYNTEVNLLHHTYGGTLRGKLHYYNNHRRLPGPVTLYTDDGDERLAEQTATAQTFWQQNYGRFDVMVGGKYAFSESLYRNYDAQYPNGLLAQYYWQREWYATAGVGYTLGDIALSYAADAGTQSLNSNLHSNNHVSRDALLQALSVRYAAGRFSATARLGAHLYFNHAKGAEAAQDAQRLTPMVSLSWLVLNGQEVRLMLRTFYQELFRVPTFTEAYHYHLGEQNLKPELTRQTGMGLTLMLRNLAAWWPQLSLTADAYHNAVTDRIQSLPYTLQLWKTVNLGKVKATGLDATLESRLSPLPRHDFYLTANYSFLKSSDRSIPGSTGYGQQTAYTPQHSGGASLAWENPWCNFVTHVSYASERWSTNEHTAETRLPAFAEFGCGLYRSFILAGMACEVRADWLNVFDCQYEIVRRYPMPGRAYKLSLKVNF